MEKSVLWTVKYAPRSLGECAGNDEARERMRKWALQWQARKRQKPLLLNGPTGAGKTACGRGLGREMDWLLVETAASDLRNREKLEKVYGLTGASAGLFGQTRLLFFDEVDSALDSGEVTELQAVLKNASQPALLVANDAWNPKLAPIRFLCELVDFRAINSLAVKKVLKKIAEAENIGGNADELIEEIAAKARGDLRAAITDLQAGFAGERERKSNVFSVVGKIFKTQSYSEAVRAGDESEVDFNLLSRWLEENIPSEYEAPEEVFKAFDALSRADVFRGRKMRRQHHELYKYERALTLAGVALSKKQRYAKFTRYSFPSIVKELAAARASRNALNEIASAASRKMHCSRREALESVAFLAGCAGMGSFLGVGDEAQKLVAEAAGGGKRKK